MREPQRFTESLVEHANLTNLGFGEIADAFIEFVSGHEVFHAQRRV